MSDQAGLKQAILDAPKDDAPRLVYADWIDEFTDYHELAAFIRWQVWHPEEVATRNGGVVTISNQECNEQFYEWFSEHVRQSFPGFYQVTWRRGFAESLSAPADQIYRHLDGVLKVSPVTRATVTAPLSTQYRQDLEQKCRRWGVETPEAGYVVFRSYKGQEPVVVTHPHRWMDNLRAMFNGRVKLSFTSVLLRPVMEAVAEDVGRRVAEEIERLIIGTGWGVVRRG